MRLKNRNRGTKLLQMQILKRIVNYFKVNSYKALGLRPRHLVTSIEAIDKRVLAKATYSISLDENTLPIHIEDQLPASFYEYNRESLQKKCCNFYLAHLRHATYLNIGGHDSVIYKGAILEPLSFTRSYFGLSNKWVHPALRIDRYPQGKVLKGKSLLLSTIGAAGNYGHWIIDLLPRIGYTEYFGHKWNNFNHILINGLEYPFQQELVDMLGIPREKIFETGRNECIYCEELVVPSNAHHSMFGLKVIREKLLPLAKSTAATKAVGKRIYLSRSRDKWMCIVNEEAVFDVLKRHGFQSIFIQDFSVSEQIEIFKNADFVVSPQGSGLTNSLLMNPGAMVLEVFNREYINTTFLVYGLFNKLKYGALFAEPVDCTYPHRKNIRVDVEKLQLTLSKMLD